MKNTVPSEIQNKLYIPLLNSFFFFKFSLALCLCKNVIFLPVNKAHPEVT